MRKGVAREIADNEKVGVLSPLQALSSRSLRRGSASTVYTPPVMQEGTFETGQVTLQRGGATVDGRFNTFNARSVLEKERGKKTQGALSTCKG